MKSVQGSFNISIVGKWNKFILSPNWVKKFLFENKEIQVAFPLELTEPYFYEGIDKGIRFIPQEDRVLLVALREEDELLKQIDNMLLILISELNKTPIIGIGYNYRFFEDRNKCDIENTYILKDESKIKANEYNIRNTQIIRNLSYKGLEINETVTYSTDKYSIDFNFHNPINNIDEYIDILKSGEQGIIKCRDIALSFLTNVYGLKLE
ncbi:MAG: hypothetical protein A2Y33_12020 [Spirochaetes bacterium GWF1_51_8]|nr:MAG: hypothetical protein A2Y33_12020 [Spirochaetes bacterium GWF1_51_8]